MKTTTLWVLLLAVSLTSISCGDDDNPEEMVVATDDDGGMTDDGDEAMAELVAAQETTTAGLTAGGEGKVWRIEQATLNNASGSIDISENFNVVDDEFVFSGTRVNGSLEWRQGNAIGVEGASAQETLLDFYKAPVSSSFSFDANSSTNLSGLDGDMTFEVVDENTITGTLTFNEGRRAGETMGFDLTTKTSEDYATPPESGLDFSNAFTYSSNCVAGSAPGMIGSYSDNSFFIVTRERINEASVERVVKFNLDTGTSIEQTFDQVDFISKQLHVIDNKLIAFGGQFVNTYNLNLQGSPSSINHGRSLSRHGMAVQGNTAYIIGGDLNDVNGDKILAFNLTNQTLTELATMPESRSGARGTIVNNKLYIFGGTTAFVSGDPKSTIYVYDLVNGGFETFDMGVALNFTYVDKFQNLIYVAGQTETRNGDNEVTGRDQVIGVFDTTDNTFTQTNTNLPGTQADLETIHGMCIFNNSMYVLYGGTGVDNGNEFRDWQVLSAPIN